MRQSEDGAQLNSHERLFLGLAEQLVRPWLQVTQLAELATADDLDTARLRWQATRAISQSSIQLLESYALSLRVQGKLTPLVFEPVSISSLLYDTAHALQPFARQYDVTLEIDASPRMEPILADRAVVRSALLSLGQVFILGQAEADESSAVHLNAHRGRYGVVAGLYGNTHEIGTDSLRRARELQGRAREPFQRLLSGPAAGVFVADSLLQTLAAHLHVARYHNLTGLATTFQQSRQLQLV